MAVFKTNVDVLLHRDTVYIVNIVANQLLPSQKFKAFKNALTLDVGGLEVQHSGFNGDIQSRQKKAFLVADGLFAKTFSGGIVKMKMNSKTHLNAMNKSKEFDDIWEFSFKEGLRIFFA